MLVTGGLAYDRLERITAAAARRGNLSPRARAEIPRWTRIAAGTARDGIPATALASNTGWAVYGCQGCLPVSCSPGGGCVSISHG